MNVDRVVTLSLDEYSPYLNNRCVKSTLVMSNSVITKDMKKYPYSFSIPTIYSPSFSSQQGFLILFLFYF